MNYLWIIVLVVHQSWILSHELYSHVMPFALTLVSHDADGIINGTTEFKSRWSRGSATWLFLSWDTIGTNISITWCSQHCQWNHYKPYVQMTELRCNVSFLVMWCQLYKGQFAWHQWHDVNFTTFFLRLRQSKWGAAWPIWSCDAISISIN